MFLSRNKKNNVYPCKPQFYYIEVGFKGVRIIQVWFRNAGSIYLKLQLSHTKGAASMWLSCLVALKIWSVSLIQKKLVPWSSRYPVLTIFIWFDLWVLRPSQTLYLRSCRGSKLTDSRFLGRLSLWAVNQYFVHILNYSIIQRFL